VNREFVTNREFTIHCLTPLVTPLVAAAVLPIVLAALRFELRSIDPATLWAEIVAVPRDRLSSTAGLTALNYVALTGYDFVAFAYVGRRLARWRVMLTSFLSYPSLWLGFFVFKHVEYSHDLWWQFELRGDASRFLRASVGAGVLLFVVALTRLIGFAPHEAPSPSAADLDDAARIIAGQRATSPYLALGGDKSLLFDDERTAFVMYGVQGRTWVALGDPVGPEDDVGMTLVKIGEEAKVDLRAFTLLGGHGAKFRNVIRRFERDGATFRVVAPVDVPSVIAALREVSDEWLAVKAGAEKGFSLGHFDEAYLSRLPIAVLEQRGRILAFANLWPGADRGELSIDLMRYRRDVPNGRTKKNSIRYGNRVIWPAAAAGSCPGCWQTFQRSSPAATDAFS